jgi:pimeloyl-ACP methyl ester carboxylesterase
MKRAVSPADSLARFMELPSPADRVLRGLTRRAGGVSPLKAGERASIVFDTGRAAWTLLIDGAHMAVVPGRTGPIDAEIRADADTLSALVEGHISGVHAFLEGSLALRGSIALALRLEADDPTFPRRPMHFPRARSVRAGELDTFYLEAGEGPPVVLLHGLGATNASMLPTLADLARDHRVLAPDLPGFGESEKPVRAYDPAFFAGWLRAFLDAVGIERAILVGNSMGGRIALEIGLVAPARVDRLVLFAPSLAFKRFRAATPLVRLVAAELGAMPLFVPRSLVMTTLRMLFARPERLRVEWYEAAVDEFVRIFASARGRMAFFSAARQIYLEEAHGEAGFWERLPALERPALFLWGDRDQLVPWRFAPHVETALPAARSIVLEDCGHVPQFEHPEHTHALVREFLGR